MPDSSFAYSASERIPSLFTGLPPFEGEEQYVGVPEEGGRDLISVDPLAPGSVYTASVDEQGKVGLYRLEVGCSAGTGKLKIAGGIDTQMKESLQRAFAYLKGRKSEMGIGGDVDTTDFHVEAIDLLTTASRVKPASRLSWPSTRR